MSVVSAAGGRLVTFVTDRRPARGLLSRRVAIDLEPAAPVTGAVRGVSDRTATGSSNLIDAPRLREGFVPSRGVKRPTRADVRRVLSDSLRYET